MFMLLESILMWFEYLFIVESIMFHELYILFRMQVEATEVFFSVTKLFQSKDTGLRRMVYLIIKELSPSSDEVCHLPQF